MPPLPDLNEITNAMSGFQGYLKKAQASALNEGLRQQLAQVDAQMQEAQAKFATEYPKTIAKQQNDLEDSKMKSDALQAQIQEMQQKAAEPPKPPQVVEEPVDPELGKKLRMELLEQFGKLSTERPAEDATSPPDFGSGTHFLKRKKDGGRR